MTDDSMSDPQDKSATDVLHQARRDRWATPLATAVMAIHFLAELFTLGWYYWIVPRIKYSLEQVGRQIPTDAIVVIKLSDLLVNYWYMLAVAGPAMLIVDFVITRWIARRLGLRVAIGFGPWPPPEPSARSLMLP